MAGHPLCYVTDALVIIYACNAAPEGRGGTKKAPHAERISAAIQRGSSRVKSDTAVYTADGCSLVQRSPIL